MDNTNISNIDITDVTMLQNAIVDLLDGKYNLGDNDFGVSDFRFQFLLDLKDAIIKNNN